MPYDSDRMGSRPALLKSDWSRVGLRMDLLRISPYEDHLPSLDKFTESNSLKNTRLKNVNTPKAIFCEELLNDIPKNFVKCSENFRKSSKLSKSVEKVFNSDS